MHIESGPTGERVVRSSLLALLCVVFAAWYSYDGWRGYARKNLDEFVKTLSAEDRQHIGTPAIYSKVTAASLEGLTRETQVKILDEPQKTLERIFGWPPSYQNSEAWYYFGPAAAFKIDVRDGRPTGVIKPLPPSHSETDIRWQRSIAVLLMIFALAAVVHLIRVRRTRAVLDEGGLRFNRRPVIGWDAMKSLDGSRFRAKGWVDLYFDADGREDLVRLDEYHLAAFDGIIEAICTRKGFENPVTALRKGDTESDDAAADGHPTESDSKQA